MMKLSFPGFGGVAAGVEVSALGGLMTHFYGDRTWPDPRQNS
jgi:hypothetical protein